MIQVKKKGKRKKKRTKEAFDKGCGSNELFIDIGERWECRKR